MLKRWVFRTCQKAACESTSFLFTGRLYFWVDGFHEVGEMVIPNAAELVRGIAVWSIKTFRIGSFGE